MKPAMKDVLSVLKKSKLALTGAALFVLAATMPTAAQTVQRDIEDFIDAQGTTTIFTPPVRDQLGWIPQITTDNSGKLPFALVDYAGKANNFLGNSLGTTFEGNVTERPLPDGRAEVTVNLHTKNALTWAVYLDINGDVLGDIANKATFFGFRAQDIKIGNTPALGNSNLRVVFKNTAPGAPLPDLVCINLGTCPDRFELESRLFNATACGLLRNEKGEIIGTGKLIITQNNPATPGKGRALQDDFPVERVEVKQLGPGASCKS